MEFLKKMKSREIIEMSLKAVMAILAVVVLAILMEGMIFGIYMNRIHDNKTGSWSPQQCEIYCVEQAEDKYDVYIHNTENGAWQFQEDWTKAQFVDGNYDKIIYSAPTPFDVSITPVHYVVMGGVVVLVLAGFGYMFYRLEREYKGFEKKLKKTGKLFA